LTIHKTPEFYAELSGTIDDFSRSDLPKMIPNPLFKTNLLLTARDSLQAFILLLKPKSNPKRPEIQFTYQYNLKKLDMARKIPKDLPSWDDSNPRTPKIIPARPKCLKTSYLFPDASRNFFLPRENYFLTALKIMKHDHTNTRTSDVFNFADNKILELSQGPLANIQPKYFDYRPKKIDSSADNTVLFASELFIENS
jgi:hypothetical protein